MNTVENEPLRPFFLHARLCHHFHDKGIPCVHHSRPFVRAVDFRIHLAAQRFLHGMERADHLGEPRVTDDQQVDIAGRRLPAAGHGTEHKGPIDPPRQRLKRPANHIKGVTERCVILERTGCAEVAGAPPLEVGAGDGVMVPRGASQRIRNVGVCDLVFLAVCTPQFAPDAYEDIDSTPCDMKPRNRGFWIHKGT